MSQPRQQAPSSPTPSKSSLRRASGPQNPSQRSLIPPPSPRFDDQQPAPVRYSPRSPPNQTLEYESDEDDEPLIYPDPPPAPEQDSYFPYPEPERPFQPFFTLIEDGLTSEHHHPSVHYIFADDDTELITEAALRSLSQDKLGGSSEADNSAAQPTQSHNDASQQDTRLPPLSEGVKEHYLILDIHPMPQAQAVAQQAQQSQTHSQSHSTPHAEFPSSTYAIASHTSLSPEWQITSASITSAPTMGEAPMNEDEGLMLRIEGRGVPAEDPSDFPGTTTGGGGGGDKEGRAREALEDMIERFQNRLSEVRRLIEFDGGATGGLLREGGGVGGPGGDGTSDTGYNTGQRGGYGLEEQD